MFSKMLSLSVCLAFVLPPSLAHGDGLDFNYGKNLPDVTLGTTTYKVLARGTLNPGESIRVTNVLFERKVAAALIAAFGLDNKEGAHQLTVTDATNNELIGMDTLRNNRAIVAWVTGNAAGSIVHFRVNLRLTNAGSAPITYTLIASW